MDQCSATAETVEVKASVPVKFTGKNGEFFGIWVVNILLSIVTLGIYSAWAKVRTNQYFYGNTSIDGHHFRYLAQPMKVLKGRLVATAALIVFNIASSLNPLVGLILFVLMLIASPWLLVQGIRFNMRMTSYRNVRFGFQGSYWGALLYFIVLPVASVLTFFLALPWVLKKIDQFVHENISYGKQPLKVNTSTGTYYIAALACVGLMLVVGVVFSIFFGASVMAEMSSMQESGSDVFANIFVLVGMSFAYWLLFALVSAVYRAIIRNHLFASSEIEQVCRFNSEVRALPFAWINFSNVLLIVLTIGLAHPIAAIRKARYLASVTTVKPIKNALTVIEEQQQSSVYGEEAAEIFDVDFAVG